MVLDLFSGLEGFSQAFKDRGHFVYTVDINPKFKPNWCIDINDIEIDKNALGKFDIVLASPPCEKFSIMAVGKNFNGLNKETRKSIKLVFHTLDLIEDLNPKYWVLENPMGMLRKIIGKPDYEITQCQYGRKFMKPTDLWGVLPASFIPKRCKNGDSCHTPAPRGSRSGIQGSLSKEERSKIPYGLSLAICESVENE